MKTPRTKDKNSSKKVLFFSFLFVSITFQGIIEIIFDNKSGVKVKKTNESVNILKEVITQTSNFLKALKKIN
jgi:hypothetical protein